MVPELLQLTLNVFLLQNRVVMLLLWLYFSNCAILIGGDNEPKPRVATMLQQSRASLRRARPITLYMT